MSADVESRLRRALDAKAGQVTPERLQPAVPPTAAPARRSWRLRWWPLVAATAAVMAVVLAVRWPGDTTPSPAPNPPAATVPSPEPTAPEPLESPVPTPTGDSARPTVASTPPATTPPTGLSSPPGPGLSTGPTAVNRPPTPRSTSPYQPTPTR